MSSDCALYPWDIQELSSRWLERGIQSLREVWIVWGREVVVVVAGVEGWVGEERVLGWGWEDYTTAPLLVEGAESQVGLDAPWTWQRCPLSTCHWHSGPHGPSPPSVVPSLLCPLLSVLPRRS